MYILPSIAVHIIQARAALPRSGPCRLDATAARQAVEDLRDWPGERFGHRSLLDRAWDFRDDVRPWDALYVALAEGLDATLITLDRRLAAVSGLACQVEVVAR